MAVLKTDRDFSNRHTQVDRWKRRKWKAKEIGAEAPSGAMKRQKCR